MKGYELLCIFPPEAAPDVQKTQGSNLEALVKKFNGTVSEKLELGRKSLGYPIKKFREGNLMLFHFQMDSLKTTEFRKALELEENLLKYMLTIRNQKSETKPAPRVASGASRPNRDTASTSQTVLPRS